MKKIRKFIHLNLLILFVLLFFVPSLASGQQPVVRAVLFYSPTCPHCHDVMENALPPIVERYPNQLDIIGIDVSHKVGLELYQASIAAFQIPEDRLGVPTLIVGTNVLVGSIEIAEIFPQIVQTGLSAGGIDWPPIPNLDKVLASQTNPISKISEPAPMTEPASQAPIFIQRFNQDPLANTIAVIVLIGMSISAAAVLINYLQGSSKKFLTAPAWSLPLVSVIGLGIAIYLSYVELTHTTAVCGPVGNCNSVQDSPYAVLFGILPVGVLGIIGYSAILGSWLFSSVGPILYRNFFKIAIWGMAWFGVLFAIYLTFLEPFVIGATCAWCIANSIIMTFILLASTQPAKEALRIDELDELVEIEEEDSVKETFPGKATPPAS